MLKNKIPITLIFLLYFLARQPEAEGKIFSSKSMFSKAYAIKIADTYFPLQIYAMVKIKYKKKIVFA